LGSEGLSPLSSIVLWLGDDLQMGILLMVDSTLVILIKRVFKFKLLSKGEWLYSVIVS
jgi:hypothetical protein